MRVNIEKPREVFLDMEEIAVIININGGKNEPATQRISSVIAKRSPDSRT